ncbi:MAG: hypothetical protein AAB089_07915 [Nitrospirota bacterium]
MTIKTCDCDIFKLSSGINKKHNRGGFVKKKDERLVVVILPQI